MGPKISLALNMGKPTDPTTLELRIGAHVVRSEHERQGPAYAAARDIARDLGLTAVVGIGSGKYRWESAS